jgi:cytochrome c-type biogenesis protein CcmH
MLTFWIVAALLVVAALAFVLVPLLRNRPPAGPSVREANLAVLRGQRQEIENDVALGVLPRDARESALAELVTRAGQDLESTPEPGSASGKRPWGAAAFFAILIPAAAIGLYLALGNPDAMDPSAASASAPPLGDKQIEAMVESLDQKVRARPDDVQGWMLLARSYAALGKTQKALDAYRHLVSIAPGDANVLADYADALALSRGKNLSGEPAQLVMQALKLDPNHPKALALAGTAMLNSGEFAASMGYWERLFTVVGAASEDATEIRNIIEDVRGRAAAAGKPLPPSKVLAAAPATATPAAPATGPNALPPSHPPVGTAPAAAGAARGAPPSATPGKSISGTVKLADSLKGRVAQTDTLFIYARAESGSRMPLAILRGGAGELPKAFELDDTMGMAPNVRLSTTPSVIIEARVSKAGGAVAQAGDLVGSSAPVAPGARSVAIVIDKVIP